VAQAFWDGLYDEPRFGAPPRIGDDEIWKTLEAHPEGATHWSHFGRTLGADLSLTASFGRCEVPKSGGTLGKSSRLFPSRLPASTAGAASEQGPKSMGCFAP
jgi:hypothetical protein